MINFEYDGPELCNSLPNNLTIIYNNITIITILQL